MTDKELTTMQRLRRFLAADGWATHANAENQTDQQKKLPVPPVQKPVPEGARLIDLVPPDQLTLGQMPTNQAIADRISHRKFSAEPVSLEEVSYLLWATQGVRQVMQQEGAIMRTHRTVPSGGARHAMETYLAIERVTGVAPGLYRYLPLDHKLVLEREATGLGAEAATASLSQKFIGDGALVFIWTAIPYRCEWRYRYVAHKLIALDAGHICQNLYLACESIGLGTCAIAAYDQPQIDHLVGVDGDDELVIYLAPVGHPG